LFIGWDKIGFALSQVSNDALAILRYLIKYKFFLYGDPALDEPFLYLRNRFVRPAGAFVEATDAPAAAPCRELIDAGYVIADNRSRRVTKGKYYVTALGFRRVVNLSDSSGRMRTT